MLGVAKGLQPGRVPVGRGLGALNGSFKPHRELPRSSDLRRAGSWTGRLRTKCDWRRLEEARCEGGALMCERDARVRCLICSCLVIRRKSEAAARAKVMELHQREEVERRNGSLLPPSRKDAARGGGMGPSSGGLRCEEGHGL